MKNDGIKEKGGRLGAGGAHFPARKGDAVEKPLKRGNGLTVAIICIVVCVLAAGGAAFFMADGMRVNGAIAAVDSIRYEDTEAEKGVQREAKGVALTAEQTPESLEGDVYHTPLGFSIVSNSDNWQGEKLVEIYDELLKNGHSNEIYYLSEVVLNGGGSDYGGGHGRLPETRGTRMWTNTCMWTYPR